MRGVLQDATDGREAVGQGHGRGSGAGGWGLGRVEAAHSQLDTLIMRQMLIDAKNHAHMHTCIHTHEHAHAHAHGACTCTCTCTCTCEHTQRQANMHVHTHKAWSWPCRNCMTRTSNCSHASLQKASLAAVNSGSTRRPWRMHAWRGGRGVDSYSTACVM